MAAVAATGITTFDVHGRAGIMIELLLQLLLMHIDWHWNWSDSSACKIKDQQKASENRIHNHNAHIHRYMFWMTMAAVAITITTTATTTSSMKWNRCSLRVVVKWETVTVNKHMFCKFGIVVVCERMSIVRTPIHHCILAPLNCLYDVMTWKGNVANFCECQV